MREYFILQRGYDPRFCQIRKTAKEIRDADWRIAEGRRMGDHFPGRVTFAMHPASPGIVVPDLVDNTLFYTLVSSRLKALLETESGAEIEWLPFTLVNHKGRVAIDDGFIANVIGKVDCVDRARTAAAKSAYAPSEFLAIDRLHLDPAKIPPDARLFRIAPMPSVMIVRDDLRAQIDGMGATGVAWVAMGEDCDIQS